MAVAGRGGGSGVLRGGFGRQHRIEYKGEADLVTEADEQAERKIEKVLRKPFPDYGVLTEESGQTEGQSDARWIVDPLDCTTNYVHGVSFFCTSVALERAGEAVAGVVHGPMANETYITGRGGGATLNGESIGASGTDKPARVLLGTSFADRPEEREMGLDVFGRLEGLALGMRRLGSGALDLCYVATGRLDGCYEQGFSVWDVAAGMLIVEEAGGKVTNCRGASSNQKRAKGWWRATAYCTRICYA